MPSEARFTPGPWKAKWSRYRDGTFIVQAGMPSNRVLASFDGDGDGPDDQSIADARLIAAAPEMFEALRHCQKVLAAMVSPDATVTGAGIMSAFAQCVEAESKARATLSKALGSPDPDRPAEGTAA